MKDRIGQSSSRKKKNTESDFSNVTGVPKPDNYGGFSPDDDGMPPKKKSKLPIILCGLLAVAVVAGGGWFLLSRNGGGDVVQQPAQPSVEYPLNTAELDQDEQALQQVLQSAKSQRVPTMSCADTIADDDHSLERDNLAGVHSPNITKKMYSSERLKPSRAQPFGLITLLTI